MAFRLFVTKNEADVILFGFVELFAFITSLSLFLQNTERQPSLEAEFFFFFTLAPYRAVINYTWWEPGAPRFLRQENRLFLAQINSLQRRHKKQVDRTNLAAVKGKPGLCWEGDVTRRSLSKLWRNSQLLTTFSSMCPIAKMSQSWLISMGSLEPITFFLRVHHTDAFIGS